MRPGGDLTHGGKDGGTIETMEVLGVHQLGGAW